MSSTAMITAAVTIGVFMLAMWCLSLAVKNASIVDVGWGLGFVMVAWAVRARVDGNVDRQRLLVAMTTLWGLRLAAYLYSRNHGKGEDYRYRAMRKRWGPRFPLISLGTVFALQGALMWIVSLPVQLGQSKVDPKARRSRLGRHRGVGDRTVLRGRRRRPTGPLQARSRQRRHRDEPGPVALHAPPQLLRRRMRVVGNCPGRRRDHGRSVGPDRCCGDDGAVAPRQRGDVAGEITGQAPCRLRAVRGDHLTVHPQTTRNVADPSAASSRSGAIPVLGVLTSSAPWEATGTAAERWRRRGRLASVSEQPARIGLVLGAGGVTGGAFHAGVLSALQAGLGWDPRKATIIVGTSAGSIAAASLRAGLSAADLLARVRGPHAVTGGLAPDAQRRSCPATSSAAPGAARPTTRRDRRRADAYRDTSVRGDAVGTSVEPHPRWPGQHRHDLRHDCRPVPRRLA